MSAPAPPQDGGALVCCPVCDALHEVASIPAGARLRCVRCHTLLAVDRPEAIRRIVVLASTSLVLMSVVLFYPFLELKTGVFDSRASVYETVMTFDEGIMAPLSLAVAGFVLVLPVARLAALVWALAPLTADRAPWPGAATALRLAQTLRPWAMAEIFMVGVAVALVKLADLATLSMGPAFWSFAAIVFITAVSDAQMSRLSLWSALDTAARR